MGNHPKASKVVLTWRYLIYPGVSRGMRKNIVAVLSNVSQLRPSVDPPQLALRGVLPGSSAFSLSAYSASLTRLRSPPSSSFLLCRSPLPPLLKCRTHTCAAEICPAELISSHRWYLKPLAALHKTVTLPGTVFACVFV